MAHLYTIETAGDPATLITIVNRNIKEGFLPIGGVTVEATKVDPRFSDQMHFKPMFMQAMMRIERP